MRLLFLCALAVASLAPADAALPQVFIVAHTHLDVGWLETFDSYYYLNVSQILPGVVQEMVKDPAKTFVWAEIAYFKRWWDHDATAAQQQQVRTLVASGRFEFVDGGIVQHDQASPTALGIASQMTQGHRFLQATFNVTARVGWSIDPFGSSSSNAWLYSLMKFDALVINRISSDTMATLMAERALEFNWFPATGAPDSIFTHIFDSYFCMPGGFRWGMNGNTDPDITPANIQARADELVKDILPRFALYRTANLLVPWGCDFMFQNASRVYGNTDALIAFINAHPERYHVQLRYATASQYFAAVTAEGLSRFPRRGHDDFFPLVYANTDHHKRTVQAWSGYFSSRPVLKQLSSISESTLRAAETLFAIVRMLQPAVSAQQAFFDSIYGTLEKARWDSSIVLHHDAITGTGCSGAEGCTGTDQMGGDHNVVEDYMGLLQQSIGLSQDSIAQLVAYTLTSVASNRPTLLPFDSPDVSAVLQQRGTVAVLVYNPASQPRTETVTLPVPVSWLSVLDGTGKAIPSQLLAFSDIAPVLPRGLGRSLSYSLSFVATVPPLGYSTYFLQFTPPRALRPHSDAALAVRASVLSHARHAAASADPGTSKSIFKPHKSRRHSFSSPKASPTSKLSAGVTRGPNGQTTYVLQNSAYKIVANNVTGIESITDVRSGKAFSVSLNLLFYNSGFEDAYSYAVSGAPQPFRPDGTLASVHFVTGPLYSELLLFFNEEHGVTVRLYEDGQTNAIELQAGVGVLEENTDVILLVRTNISSQGLLYTDSNGIDTMLRRNNDSLYMQENAWPATTFASIRENTAAQLALAFSQVHTVQSLHPGEIQVVLHRRSRIFDVSGAVVLDDTLAHRETLFLTVGPVLQANRDLHSAIVAPLVTLASQNTSPSAWTAAYATAFSASSALPPPVELFSLAAADASSSRLLARFRHTYLVDEDPTFSANVTVDSSVLAAGTGRLVSQREASLSFVHALSSPANTTFVMAPGSIRSFIIDVRRP